MTNVTNVNDVPKYPPVYDLIWKALATNRDVIVFYRNVVDSEYLVRRSRPLVEWLRPCGFVSETSVDIQLQNKAWLYLRRRIQNVPDIDFKLGSTIQFELDE